MKAMKLFCEFVSSLKASPAMPLNHSRRVSIIVSEAISIPSVPALFLSTTLQSLSIEQTARVHLVRSTFSRCWIEDQWSHSYDNRCSVLLKYIYDSRKVTDNPGIF